MDARVLQINSRLQLPLDECELTYARSSGPGGQNVNKVNSKATLRWSPVLNVTLPAEVRQRFLAHYGNKLTTEGELLITSQRYRDQGRNVEDCLEKLRVMLAVVAVAPTKRRKTKPSRGSKERRLEGKRIESNKKQSRRGPADES
jgi:ribosome-associated protein